MQTGAPAWHTAVHNTNFERVGGGQHHDWHAGPVVDAHGVLEVSRPQPAFGSRVQDLTEVSTMMATPPLESTPMKSWKYAAGIQRQR